MQDLDADGYKITNLKDGENDKDVMSKKQIENLVTTETELLDGARPSYYQ